MTNEWADLITYFSTASILLPILISIFRWQQINPLQRLIAYLAGITLIGELVILIAAYQLGNNLPFIHLFTVIQFIVLSQIFKRGLVPFISSSIIQGLVLFIIGLALVDAIWLNGIYNFNSYARPLASLILISLGLAFLYKTLSELKIRSLEREPLFWITVGVLLYFSGNLIIFISTNYVKISNQALLTLWSVHAIFNIILNTTYAIALWVRPRD